MITLQFLTTTRFGHHFWPSSGSTYPVTLNSVHYSSSFGQCLQLGEGRVVVYSVGFDTSTQLEHNTRTHKDQYIKNEDEKCFYII
jgi:hypothetical protein